MNTNGYQTLSETQELSRCATRDLKISQSLRIEYEGQKSNVLGILPGLPKATLCLSSGLPLIESVLAKYSSVVARDIVRNLNQFHFVV